MVADSALGRNGQPWFIPDFGSDWRWTAMLALRVGRLGKCISPKFASRYVDAMTLIFVPVCDAPGADVLLGCMDGGAVPGAWQPIQDPVVCGDLPPVSLTALGADDFIALVSRYVTLKTGDILALPLLGIEERPAMINSRVDMALSGLPALSFNIK